MASVSNDYFVAYIDRYPNCALIVVYARPEGQRYQIDFSTKIEEYETLGRGATASARRTIDALTVAKLKGETA